MKISYLFLLLVFSCMNLFSQDTLYTKNGERIPGKVIEITQDEIKYKKSSNPDGPLYILNKSEIALIEYKNGSKDVFNSSDTNSEQNNEGSVASNGGTNFNSYYITPGPRVSVVVPHFFAFTPWIWGNWGYRSFHFSGHHKHNGHHRHHGHYGRRGR